MRRRNGASDGWKEEEAMRIAIFTETFLPKIDGITNRLRHTVEELVAAGHELRIFGPSTSVEEHAGARVVRVPGLPFPPYPELRVTVPGPRTALELVRFRPEVVHAVCPASLGVWGLVTARALRIPAVASYHTDFPRYAGHHGLGFAEAAVWPLIRAVHNLAQLNLCPSRFTRDELEAHGVRNVGIWRGAVDSARFHPGKRTPEMRARLTQGEVDAPLLLCAARLSPEKKLDTLRPVLENLPHARLAIVGDGPARSELERHYAGFPVVFTGFLRGEELAQAFASADVFVMPSTTETLGFVVLEAMSSGRPVVAARAGGIPDLVQHGENGILYDPEDPEALLDAVEELLSEPGRARFYGEQARKAAERATWRSETRELVWSYRRAIKAHRSANLVRMIRYA
jgi:glycosyltransferase involved in cell wall biosynthesis